MKKIVFKNEYELGEGFTQVVEWYDDNTCVYYIENKKEGIKVKGTGKLNITHKN